MWFGAGLPAKVLVNELRSPISIQKKAKPKPSYPQIHSLLPKIGVRPIFFI